MIATPLLAEGEPPGWFGKLPCVGDFASRRLDDATRAAWDGWLSQGMVALRASLGDAWLERYLDAPLVYWLQSPDADGRWCIGTLMSSVDSAGRYFPLVIVQPLMRVPVSVGDWSLIDQRLDALAQTSLAMLEEAARIDAFEARLQAASRMPAAQARCDESADTIASWLLAQCAPQLADASLWWRRAKGGVAIDARVDARWPGDESFVALWR